MCQAASGCVAVPCFPEPHIEEGIRPTRATSVVGLHSPGAAPEVLGTWGTQLTI